MSIEIHAYTVCLTTFELNRPNDPPTRQDVQEALNRYHRAARLPEGHHVSLGLHSGPIARSVSVSVTICSYGDRLHPLVSGQIVERVTSYLKASLTARH